MREITPNTGFYAQIRPYLPDNLQRIVDLIPEDIASKTNDSLHILCLPSPQMRSFKNLFWKALDLAVARRQQLSVEEARCNLIPENVYFAFTANAVKVAWLLARDIPYDVASETYLHDILKKFGPILDKPLIDEHGIVDWKLFDAHLKLYGMLDKRMHGNYVQKIEEKSVRLTGRDVKEAQAAKEGQKNFEQLKHELEQKLIQSQNAGGQGFIDVTKVESTDDSSSK